MLRQSAAPGELCVDGQSPATTRGQHYLEPAVRAPTTSRRPVGGVIESVNTRTSIRLPGGKIHLALEKILG